MSEREATKEYYDSQAKDIQKRRDQIKYDARISCALLSRIDVKKGMRVLEVGVGTGNLLIDLAERVGEGGKVVGADISDSILRELSGKIEGMRNLSLIKWDVCSSFEDTDVLSENGFDIVLLISVLDHIAEPIGPVETLCRLVSPQGRLAITVPKRSVFGRLLAFFARRKVPSFRHDPQEIINALRDSGFQIDQASDIGLGEVLVIARKG